MRICCIHQKHHCNNGKTKQYLPFRLKCHVTCFPSQFDYICWSIFTNFTQNFHDTIKLWTRKLLTHTYSKPTTRLICQKSLNCQGVRIMRASQLLKTVTRNLTENWQRCYHKRKTYCLFIFMILLVYNNTK